MKKNIKWYQDLWPDEKYRVKNGIIAVAVLTITTAILGPMFIYAMTHEVHGNWPFAIQGFVIALGGLLIGAYFFARFLKGKR